MSKQLVNQPTIQVQFVAARTLAKYWESILFHWKEECRTTVWILHTVAGTCLVDMWYFGPHVPRRGRPFFLPGYPPTIRNYDNFFAKRHHHHHSFCGSVILWSGARGVSFNFLRICSWDLGQSLTNTAGVPGFLWLNHDSIRK